MVRLAVVGGHQFRGQHPFGFEAVRDGRDIDVDLGCENIRVESLKNRERCATALVGNGEARIDEAGLNGCEVDLPGPRPSAEYIRLSRIGMCW